MHHPEEEEEEDDDEFLSDDAEVGQSKEKNKLKGVYMVFTDEYTSEANCQMCVVMSRVVFCPPGFNPAEVGGEGKGYIWKASSLDDTEDEELSHCLWGTIAAWVACSICLKSS